MSPEPSGAVTGLSTGVTSPTGESAAGLAGPGPR
jgi:hypothetical protein